MSTKLLYMLDSYQFSGEGKVVSFFDGSEGKKVVILDQTIFYPQGGGQRYDTGYISSSGGKFVVEEVRFVDGLVQHLGQFASGVFAEGDHVTLNIDKENRIFYSKLQSAGHLIDVAVRRCGYLNLKPTKGAHYPEWSEVEYEGTIMADEIEHAVAQIQSDLDSMILHGNEVKIAMTSRAEAQQQCYFLPAHMPDDKPIRIVAVWDDLFIPCGGTHVRNISELSGLRITRIKSKKGTTKISYSFST